MATVTMSPFGNCSARWHHGFRSWRLVWWGGGLRGCLLIAPATRTVTNFRHQNLWMPTEKGRGTFDPETDPPLPNYLGQGVLPTAFLVAVFFMVICFPFSKCLEPGCAVSIEKTKLGPLMQLTQLAQVH